MNISETTKIWGYMSVFLLVASIMYYLFGAIEGIKYTLPLSFGPVFISIFSFAHDYDKSKENAEWN